MTIWGYLAVLFSVGIPCFWLGHFTGWTQGFARAAKDARERTQRMIRCGEMEQ